MSQPSQAPPPRRSQPDPKVEIPPEVAEILVPSLKVGISAGAVGLFVGAAGGIVRSAAPVLFSLVTGAQWFTLGASYYASRRYTIKSWGGDEKVTPGDKTKASGIAGGTAGLCGALLRGPKNILPAVAVFSLLGLGGQAMVNRMPTETQQAVDRQAGWLASKWSPVKPLSDEDYAKYIQDKILKLDVEISLIDDKIAALRETKRQREADEANRPESGA